MTLPHPIIVGGGPVGAVLALSLHQKGIAFTMLEARAKVPRTAIRAPWHCHTAVD